jgi:hypothetical protein
MDSAFVSVLSMEYAVLLLPLCGLVADAQLHPGEKMDRGARQDIILDGSP